MKYLYRQRIVMEHVHGVLGRLLNKGLMQFEFAHHLLWEYMQAASPVQMQVSDRAVITSWRLVSRRCMR